MNFKEYELYDTVVVNVSFTVANSNLAQFTPPNPPNYQIDQPEYVIVRSTNLTFTAGTTMTGGIGITSDILLYNKRYIYADIVLAPNNTAFAADQKILKLGKNWTNPWNFRAVELASTPDPTHVFEGSLISVLEFYKKKKDIK